MCTIYDRGANVLHAVVGAYAVCVVLVNEVVVDRFDRAPCVRARGCVEGAVCRDLIDTIKRSL